MERLNKYLARAGIASRREAEELIRQGRVTIDGRTVTDVSEVVDPDGQIVKVDGVRVKRRPPVYLLLHKPAGVVCTTGEADRAPRAIDFAPPGVGALHTVGRLDKDSEGLVILTNDGDFTDRLTHPRNEVPKRYRVLARGKVTNEALARLKKGVWLAEGRARATAARIIKVGPPGTLLEIELREGMNREIRRMLAKLGYKVKSLVRTAIGPLKLGGMRPGDVRPLAREEVLALLRAAEAPPPLKPAPKAETRAEQKPAPARKPPATRTAPSPARLPAAEKRRAPAEPPPAKPRPEPPSRPAAEPRFERLPDPPPEPERPRPAYVPDADGVIVVRRPPVRFRGEEE